MRGGCRPPDSVGDLVPTAEIRAHLRPFIASITGYDEQVALDAVHFGTPSPTATIVLAFTEPLDAAWGHREAGHRYPGLAAGLHTRPTVIRTHGVQHGIHLALTPTGVRAVLGLPPAELAHRMVELDEVAPELEACRVRLEEMPRWERRFAAVQDALERCIASRRRHGVPDTMAGHCWDLLIRSGGAATVAALADAAGVSRRTLTTRFHREFGVGPKAAARIIRYDRSFEMWRAVQSGAPGAPRSLAEIAAACGFSDQAHLTREWRAFGGQAPSRWESFPILQDGDVPREAG